MKIAFAAILLFAATPSGLAETVTAMHKIVLVGGVKSEGPARHDYPNGIRLLGAYLKSSPDASEIEGLIIDTYPDGWPADPAALDGVSTVVWYFDGLQKHPLLDASRRARFEAMMQRGVGLVTLHQASTVPPDDQVIRLERSLGAARYGMFDRTTELVELTPADDHPVVRGVSAFMHRDEFYPTFRHNSEGREVTPILSGDLHVQFRNGKHLVIDEATPSVVAWAFERDNGGRSFGYSGAHYLAALERPELGKLILNAIFWTAGFEVPEQGVRSDFSGVASRILQDMSHPSAKAVITRAADHQILEYPWGQLTWYVSGELGNSNTLTVGQAVIRPGEKNPRHYHPNCDEVLQVLSGHILNSMDDKTVEMHPADVVSIPVGVHHNARNIGAIDAVLAISYSSADREVVGE